MYLGVIYVREVAKMAKSTDFYEATIEQNEQVSVIYVDLFDLPYDKFDAQNPLCISDDVRLGKAKGRALPNLADVAIMGDFELSRDFPIGADTVLPAFFKRLVCKYSINDLGALIDKLPEGFFENKQPTVVVRPAILNNIKRNQDNALVAAKEFMRHYPEVCVTDGKQTLVDVMQALTLANAAQSIEKQPAKQEQTVKTNDVKTDEWLDSDDLLALCKQNAPELVVCTDAEISRYLKMARSAKADLKLEKKKLIRADAALVVCVHVNDADKVIEFVRQSFVNDEARKQKKLKATTQTVEKNQQQKEATKTVKRYFFKDVEVKPANIYKYIDKKVWKEITSKAGDDKNALLRILQDVEELNIIVNNQMGLKKEDPYPLIKNGEVCVSSTIKFKNGRCGAQGFGTLDDRARIVWATCGNIIVGTKFFAEHEGKKRMQYDNYLSDIDLDVSQLDLTEYLSVTALIRTLSDGRGGPGGGATGQQLDKKTPGDDVATVADATENVAEEVASVADAVVTDAADTAAVRVETKHVAIKSKRPRISRVELVGPRAKSQKLEVKKSEACAENVDESLSTDEKAHVAQEIKQRDTVCWKPLYHLSHAYTVALNCLYGQRKLLLQQMMSESGAKKLLELNRALQSVLIKTAEYEKVIDEIQQINQRLHTLQNNIEHTK